MDFPIYRKYKGIDVWFKIESPKHFTEYKLFGDELQQLEIVAKIYPEVQFINDMINCFEDRWEIVNEHDFKAFISN